MPQTLFDLKTIASGPAEPVGGNRLVIGRQQVAMVKKGLLGSSTRAVRERSTVNDVWQGRAEEIVDLAGLSVEAQRAVGAAGTNRPNETFLVIAFDDGAFEDVYWVLQGDAVDVGSAAAALEEPSGSPMATAGGASVPPRQHGARKPLLIVVMAAVAVIGVAAAGIFLLVGEVNGGSDSGSDQPAAREAPPRSPMEDDRGGAPGDDMLEPPPEQSSDASPFEPGGLPAIASQLQRELGEVPRFIRIVASDEFVIMSVRLPGNGTDVDTWAWRDGDLTGPQPERVPDREAVAAQSFTRSDVRLAALPSLVKRAEAVPVEGNEVSTAVIQRLVPFDPGVVFLVNAGGPRDSVQLRANAQGRVTEILR